MEQTSKAFCSNPALTGLQMQSRWVPKHCRADTSHPNLTWMMRPSWLTTQCALLGFVHVTSQAIRSGYSVQVGGKRQLVSVLANNLVGVKSFYVSRTLHWKSLMTKYHFLKTTFEYKTKTLALAYHPEYTDRTRCQGVFVSTCPADNTPPSVHLCA